MSTGFEPIALLKAAPEPRQIAERLEGGPWQGLELCLAAHHVADERSLAGAVRTVTDALGDPPSRPVTAEAPVSWPSGAFVRVDRLDSEARQGIERSAEFARGVGSPVLTIHPFVPLGADEFRAAGPLDRAAVRSEERRVGKECSSRWSP